MSKIADNDFHAFPTSTVDGFTQHGMTLRDYFAGQALAMTAPAYVNLPESANILARRCYEVADAMLLARAAPSKELT